MITKVQARVLRRAGDWIARDCLGFPIHGKHASGDSVLQTLDNHDFIILDPKTQMIKRTDRGYIALRLFDDAENWRAKRIKRNTHQLAV